jgi:D-lactate dehydrogenase
MKIAIFSTHQYDRQFFDRFNTGHELTYFELALNEKTASLTEGFDAICIFVNDTVNKDVITILQENGIKIIALRCAGYNNVDIVTANTMGIVVVRVPSYSPEAVAEHTLALILALNRKTHKAYNRVREGNFSLEKLMGFNLYKSKAAIIGTGHIGKAVCRILKGFGCEINAYDIYPDPTLVAEGVVYKSFEATVANADIVSLHCPLTDETRHMINKDTLKLFKHGAMLINTSRGALIKTIDVINAIKTGQLGYLGLDVYEQEGKLFFHDLSEDLIQDDLIMRLISFPNVLITSHQGFFTDEAMSQIATTTFNNIDSFANGDELLNKVTQ